MIIEILGMPRSNKSTFIEKVSNKISNTNFVFEAFDQVPYETPESFEFNYWYANYIVDLCKNVQDNGPTVIERGVNDRIAMGKALHKSEHFTKTQLQEYLNLLEPYKHYSDILVIFIISPEESMRNVKSEKTHFTRSLNFLKILYREYEELSSAGNSKNTFIVKNMGEQDNILSEILNSVA